MPLLLFGEYTEVAYITYTMATLDSPDIYARACGPRARAYNYIRQIPYAHGITITNRKHVFSSAQHNHTVQ